MKGIRRWLGHWPLGALLGVMFAGSGCSGVLHPIDPSCFIMAPGPEVSPQVRRHVHVFLMNGIDPLWAGNLSAVRDYLQKLGYTQTYYGQIYHRGWFESEMARIRKDDPSARLVLIGYGGGAKTLHGLGEIAAAQGSAVDVLLVLDGASEGLVPEGVAGIFPVRSLGAAHQPETLAQLKWELGESASHVSLPPEVPPPLVEPGPTPRPLPPQKAHSYGPDWDSLRPVSRLPEPRTH
jgi:hypothetical protein